MMISNFPLAAAAAQMLEEDAAIAAEKASRFEEPVERIIAWLGANFEGLLVGALVATGIVGLMLVLRSLGRLYQRRPHDHVSWKGIIASVLARTGMLFMIVAAIEIVVSHTDVPGPLARMVDIAFIIVAAFQAAAWARELILGIIYSKVEEDAGETTLGNAYNIIRVLVSVAAFALALIVILDNLGVNVTTLVAGLGVGGIAIGLAAQGIFSDLFAALSIVFDRPFRRGDTIRYGTTTGTVEKIGLKTTRIRSVTGEQVIMANTQLLEQEVHNIAEAHSRRIIIPIGVIYQTPIDKLKRMRAIVTKATDPYEEIEVVRCICTGFGDSSINFELVYDHTHDDWNEIVGTQSQICIRILELFAEEGIDFAYPTQTTFTAAPDGTMIMPYATSPVPKSKK